MNRIFGTTVIPDHHPSVEEALNEFRAYTDVGMAGELLASSPEVRTLIKAFRLKRFGRCPRCDGQGVVMLRQGWDHHTDFGHNCGWTATVTDLEWIAANHPDDIFIELCRKEDEQ